MLRARFTGLWRHGDFLRFWIGQTISVVGSCIGASALAFTAVNVLHATPFQLGLLGAARLGPGFLAGLAAGAWVDRLRRRPILIGADLGRALLLGTIPLASLLGLLSIVQLYGVMFLVSLLTLLFDVTYQSYLPSLVGRTELVEGNSKLAASASIAEFSGIALSGWLVQIFTAPVAVLFDALSFAASAISVWLIRKPELPPVRPADANLRAEVAEGVQTILRHRVLLILAACTLSKEFFGGVFGALVMLYMIRDLAFAPAVLGLIWSIGGISSLVGAATAGKLFRRFGIGPALIAGLLIYSVTSFFIPLARGATISAALLLILQQIFGDGPATIYQIAQLSLRQTITPERLLGRVNAGNEFLRLGASLGGTLAGGLLGEMIGVRQMLFYAAAGSSLSAFGLAFSHVRKMREAPLPAI